MNEQSTLERPDTVTRTELDARFAQLREELKEREISFPRSLKTAIEDIIAWLQNKREFPRAAVLGAVFAYMRPRTILILGSVAAFGAVLFESYLLLTQNRLVSQQNTLIQEQTSYMKTQTAQMEKQTEAARVQAVSVLVASLTGEDSVGNQLAVAQLAENGTDAVPVLLRVAVWGEPSVSSTAMSALMRQGELHSGDDVARTFQAWWRVCGPGHRISLVSDARTHVLCTDANALQASREYFAALEQRLAREPAFRPAILSRLGGEGVHRLAGTLAELYYQSHPDLQKRPRNQAETTAAQHRLEVRSQWHRAVWAFCQRWAGRTPFQDEAFSEDSEALYAVLQKEGLSAVEDHIGRWMGLHENQPRPATREPTRD